MRGSTAGLAEGTIETRNTLHDAFLVLLDILFASVIAAPVVIAHWRGAWNLMQYIFQDDPLASAVATTFLGFIGHFFFFYCSEWLNRTFHPDKNRLTFMCVSRIYTLVYGFICISAWRGPWVLMDMYWTPSHIPTLTAVTVIGTILLVFCKGLRNVSSTPFGVSTDHSKDYFVTPTMFKSSVSFTRYVVAKPA